uniref:Uncharacterized protein n=1 Tax=Anopheles melas TaxID=34690 RepID=A0A182TIJ9_9DIPT
MIDNWQPQPPLPYGIVMAYLLAGSIRWFAGFNTQRLEPTGSTIIISIRSTAVTTNVPTFRSSVCKAAAVGRRHSICGAKFNGCRCVGVESTLPAPDDDVDKASAIHLPSARVTRDL